MYCISISNKTTPVSIRQLFSFSEEEQIEFEKQILMNEQILGCVIVSTCNRSEIYFSGDKTSIDIIQKEVSRYKQIDQREILKYFHVYSNEGAMRHLFRVSCGLDSMVLGEDEILRQVKDAYQLSLENKFTNNELNMAFQGALSSAKLIKTDTKISNTPVSIGTLTANRVIEFFEQNNGSNVLIVGVTGKMGSIIAKNLICKNNLNIIGTSRSHNSSSELFENSNNIKIVEYKDRYQHLEESEVIVSATTSPHYTFTYSEVSNTLKENIQSKLFIDLAVPCDIDKEIATINGIEILDIDYFEKASKENNLSKLKELEKVELILNTCIDETLKNIYFNEFYPKLEDVIKKIDKEGIDHMMFHFKESLNSEQLKAVVDSLQEMAKR